MNYLHCTYEDFPHSTIDREGIINLEAHIDEPSCRILTGVIYRQVDNRNLHLHIVLPTQEKECSKKFPLIVYVQGSAWGKQSTARELAQLSRFALKGFVIAIVEYRDSTYAKFPAQIIDTKYAIHYLVTNSDKYFIDNQKIILWGDSSGGHTAIMTAITKHRKGFVEKELEEHKISCVIDFYAPTDLYRMAEEPTTQDHRSSNSPEGMILGGVPVTEDSAQPMKITNYLKQQNIPIFIVHGSKDRKVPFGQSVLLYDKLKQLGWPVVCYKLIGADHGGSWFWNHEIFDLVEKFIQKNIS